MQCFFVYILKCADNSYYVGSTSNLEQRILDHSAKKFGGYTSTRLPTILEWSMQCSSRAEALMLEKNIKGWSRIKKQSLIEGRLTLSSSGGSLDKLGSSDSYKKLCPRHTIEGSGQKIDS